MEIYLTYENPERNSALTQTTKQQLQSHLFEI